MSKGLTKRILILGGGFAGLYEAMKLEKTLTRDPDVQVTLVNRENFLHEVFALAYAALGRMYDDIGESDLSAESTSKAYELRERVSDREKFFISASYDLQVTGKHGEGATDLRAVGANLSS